MHISSIVPRILPSLLLMLALGSGCGIVPTLEKTIDERDDAHSDTMLQETVYTAFIINVHDWVYPEDSAATLNRIIDIHEQYSVPVDIYLDDQVLQMYEEHDPDLLSRLKTSPQVAVSYHLRPPSPYYQDFDWLNLAARTPEMITNILQTYETHRLDLETGETLEEPGGYQHLKDVVGYAPYVVAGTQPGKIRSVADALYANMGAQMTLVHGRTTTFGEKENGLWLRPEDLEVKVYEDKAPADVTTIINEALSALPVTRPAFLNLKWHENNFYTSGTPWAGPYFTNYDRRTGIRQPPFDLSKSGLGATAKSAEEQKTQWERYESLVRYIAEHGDVFTAVNAPDVLELLNNNTP